MGFKENGVEFNFSDPALYHYEAFKSGNLDSEELRAEYSRLRKIANKRLQRMEGTKYEESQTYLKNAGKYITIKEIEQQAQIPGKNLTKQQRQQLADSYIAKKTSDLYKMLTARTGSIRGMQSLENDIVNTLRERGFTFINKGNINSFGNYMEYLRILHRGQQFDSEQAAELFGSAIKKGIDPQQIAQDYSFWESRQEELDALPKIKNKNMRSASEYKKMLDIE